ncbi:glycosyltransferase family A protein [Cohnella fermenti]|uniref:Glycosyltransferase family 2 protein n=1 Tax=Cohnella fermenti TaxID=2565925 RepID=A0A4V3WDS7_9BACL|nr:glycosyltransferase family A protein [Cohnella fermenti]THF73354.1 glycosyltransferase family 2 protein [Cohnella fermenti]
MRRVNRPASRRRASSRRTRAGARKPSSALRRKPSVRQAGRRRASVRRRGPGRRARAAGGLRTAWLQSLREEGEAFGSSWRASYPKGSAEALRGAIQQRWQELLPSRLSGSRAQDWQACWGGAEAFGEGASRRAGVTPAYVPLVLRGTAAAVVHVGAGSRQTRSVLQTLDCLPLHEIILVCGSIPESLLGQWRQHSRATIAHFPEGVDSGIGRALGAKLAGTDIVLFLDGDQPLGAEELARFLWECDGRLDVALNDRSRNWGSFHLRDKVDWLHEFLNVTLGRADLKANTMAELPCALSRTALDEIGTERLVVPVKAHAAAVLKGLKIGSAASVGTRPSAPAGHDSANQTRLSAGDHLEAWRSAMEARGKRLYFGDKLRNRKAVGGVVWDADIHHHT